VLRKSGASVGLPSREFLLLVVFFFFSWWGCQNLYLDSSSINKENDELQFMQQEVGFLSSCCVSGLWGSEIVPGHLQDPQNHRMLGFGRDLCGSSSPTLLPKQGHLQQTAQDRVQEGPEYLQRRRLHSLPGQPVPVLHHPQSEEVLPHVQTELRMLQFVPVAPCPVTGHH